MVGEEAGHDLGYRAARLDPPARLVQDGARGGCARRRLEGPGVRDPPSWLRVHPSTAPTPAAPMAGSGSPCSSEVLHPRHETLMGRPAATVTPSSSWPRSATRPCTAPSRPGRRAAARPRATRGRRRPRRASTEVSTPSGLALLGGRVLPVVAGQIQVLQVQERTVGGAVRAPRRRFGPLLEGREMRLDDRIGHGWTAKAGERTLAPRSATGPAPRRHSRAARRTPGPRGRTSR